MPSWRSAAPSGAGAKAIAAILISGLLLAACGGGQPRQVPRDRDANLHGITIAELQRNPDLCLFAMGSNGYRVDSVADQPLEGGCGLINAVTVNETSVGFNRGFTATCPLAATFAIFEADVLQPAAERHFGQSVAEVEHWGTYACRNRNGRTAGPRSEHATGNAIDIAGFRLADGRRITVVDGWDGNKREREFLREVHYGACRLFQGVIGPDGDSAHHDHFHFDMGGWRFCS